MERILLVEDDEGIVAGLTEYLKAERFLVSSARTKQEALKKLETEEFDLALLDVSLPDGSGYSLCPPIKERGIPVIFVTASGDEYSVVAGLDMGADDYVSKPFRPRELLSRIRSVLRRSGGSQTLSLGDVTLDPVRGMAKKAGKELYLSALEYRLLLAFMNNKGQVLTRSRLMEEIWDAGGDFVNDNTLTVYIKRLREKIEDDPTLPKLIVTVRGMGYRAEG
ncbi:MAG: response regulator transcription factor [Christensenellales bacterium]|jgi:DNA-binding response OmpR family regulator